MTMKSHLDPNATEVLNPVPQATEKLHADSQATEKLAPVAQVTEKLTPVIRAIPAQRQDSRPGPSSAAVSAHAYAPAHTASQRPRWEHLPTEHHPDQPTPTQRPTPESAPKQQSAPKPSALKPQRWQRSAVATAPQQGTLAAAGLAACDYLTRTVSILGLLAVVGMVTAGTAQTQTQQRTPGTTVANAPAHPGAFTSTRHRG